MAGTEQADGQADGRKINLTKLNPGCDPIATIDCIDLNHGDDMI